MTSFGLNSSNNKIARTPNSAPFLTLSYFEYTSKNINSNIIDNFSSIKNAQNNPAVSIGSSPYENKTIKVSVGPPGLQINSCYYIPLKADKKYKYEYIDKSIQGFYRQTDLLYVDNLKQSLNLEFIDSISYPGSDNQIKYESGEDIFYFKTPKSLIGDAWWTTAKERGFKEGAILNMQFFGKESEKNNISNYDQHTIDFSYISSREFGFGFERKTLQGTSRKSIQQTKGLFGLDSVDGSFYIDTWANSPDKMTIGGVVQIPQGYDYPIRFFNGTLKEVGRQNNPTVNSFIGTIEEFYQKNSNPLRVNRGEFITLNDYYTGEFYIVTIKSRNFEESVDSPNIIKWSLELIVLQKIDIKSFQGAKIENKGWINSLF